MTKWLRVTGRGRVSWLLINAKHISTINMALLINSSQPKLHQDFNINLRIMSLELTIRLSTVKLIIAISTSYTVLNCLQNSKTFHDESYFFASLL